MGSVPVQITLLFVNSTALAVSFVSFEASNPAQPPIAEVREESVDGDASIVTLDGFSTRYDKSRVYHHVILGGLRVAGRYSYRVAARSGAPWSPWHAITRMGPTGPTRIAWYGDMSVAGAWRSTLTRSVKLYGVGSRNGEPSPMLIGNVKADVAAGRVHAVLHSGDHCYQFVDDQSVRGDAYMDVYSSLLAHTPWAPGWGNHEFDGEPGSRLLNITAGMIASLRASAGTRLSPLPTAQFYSIDIGLLHVVQLDLSCFWIWNAKSNFRGMADAWVTNKTAGPTTADFERFRAALLAFVAADLAAVNRSRTPWVAVSSHYPWYHTLDGVVENGGGERADPNAASPSPAMAIQDLEPLLRMHAVDFYFACHYHVYESTWPMLKGQLVSKSFEKPKAPFHITSGAAGPPDVYGFGPAKAWSRKRIGLEAGLRKAFTYSRLAFERNRMHFEQVAIATGEVVDNFTVTK